MAKLKAVLTNFIAAKDVAVGDEIITKEFGRVGVAGTARLQAANCTVSVNGQAVGFFVDQVILTVESGQGMRTLHLPSDATVERVRP